MGPGEANGILYLLDGLTIGHASYAYWFNGLGLPEEKPWLANQIDADRILEDAARLRRIGAEFVIVSLHWGAEYVLEPRATDVELAHGLMASGDIDLIVGHHAHVVQPVGLVEGKPVAFGLGDFLSNQSRSPTRDGVMLLVRLHRSETGLALHEMVAVPTWVDRANGHVILSAAARDSLQSSARRTAEALGSLGVSVPILSVQDARRWVLRPEIAFRLRSLCALGAC
jgi:poly-gamma-glutamate synthesis protein (capsule biosynthesis protein)